jgi:hypothetical protein
MSEVRCCSSAADNGVADLSHPQNASPTKGDYAGYDTSAERTSACLTSETRSFDADGDSTVSSGGYGTNAHGDSFARGNQGATGR